MITVFALGLGVPRNCSIFPFHTVTLYHKEEDKGCPGKGGFEDLKGANQTTKEVGVKVN